MIGRDVSKRTVSKSARLSLTNAKSNDLGRSPVHLLHRVSQCATEMFQKELGDSDLTPRQLAVMMIVAGEEGLSQAAIVVRTGIDRSTLSDVVRRLQRKGWMQRRRTREDARAYAVTLTESGQNLLRKATPLMLKADKQILAALPGPRGDQFMGALAAIVLRLEVK
jgi:MarR family transcriptional regulator, temperature-dependent positive regulator of motility